MDRSKLKRRASGKATPRSKKSDIVKISSLFDDSDFIQIAEPLVEGVNLPLWIKNNGQRITDCVHKNGVLLFRGFEYGREDDGAELNKSLPWVQTDPVFWESTGPRPKVAEDVFVASSVPKANTIFFHSDYSQSSYFAEKISFYCAQASISGGETPFADNRDILRDLDPDVLDMFERKGWAVIRNIHDSVGINFEDSFWGRSKSEVEEFCLDEGIDLRWEGECAKTSCVRDAIVTHPRTRDLAWFNHVAFWHWAGLPEVVREQMLRQFGPDGMPFNVTFGDGSVIPDDVALHIREVIVDNERSFPWQEGDFLVADNILVCHGRKPYEGDRKVCVGVFDRTRRKPFVPS